MSSRRAKPHAAAAKPAQTEPPRLWIDAAVAALVLAVVAYLARAAVTPDGVAYFENAELFARGHGWEAIQGYWSPGYSWLLMPVVWIARDDRALFLALAHLVQALLGGVALWLSVAAVRKHVPAMAQRAVFWACAWIIVRWLTQELLTPDLLLCVVVLAFVSRFPVSSERDELWLGLLAGAGFLVKTSIWPWLFAAAAIPLFRAWRARDYSTLPRRTMMIGASIVAALAVVMSVHAGRPTLGSVGPLNAGWYLGDLDRRTPDTDRGPHATKTTMHIPISASLPYHDLRGSTRTYAPWSDPEAWARGIPAAARPSLSVRQALKSWTENARIVGRWMVPLGVGLAWCVLWLGAPASGKSRIEALLDRPMVLVGVLGTLVFCATHAETRLLAPSALLCLFGAWPATARYKSHERFAWALKACMLATIVQLAMYVAPLPHVLSNNVASEADRHRYLDEQLARRPVYGAIIYGPAVNWMGALWRHHMHVAVQIGAEGVAQLNGISQNQRLEWFHERFGPEVLGVGEAVVHKVNGQVRADWEFIAW